MRRRRPSTFVAVIVAAIGCAAAWAEDEIQPVSFLAPEFEEPPPAPQPGDDNIVYRLVHRLIPEGSDRPIPAADISLPGPDTANFPNSPYTLPKGRSYIETLPCTYAFGGTGEPASWSWPFLLRTGLTDSCELRILSQGPTVVGATPDAPAYDGFAPLIFDMKVHLWGDRDWLYMPVVGVEVYLQTGIASRPFQVGTEPAIQLLVDHQLPGDWIFEWNVGYYGTGNDFIPDDLSSPFLGASWALQKQLTPKVSVFYQGFFNNASFPYFPGNIVSGFGGQWNLSQRLAVFGSYNWSVDGLGSPSGGYTGFAYAY